MNQQPLAGKTVIDLTTALAGPYATLLLAGLGARVIKVENPSTGGDSARNNAPYVGRDGLSLGRRHEDDMSVSMMVRGRNKLSVTLNLKDPRGRAGVRGPRRGRRRRRRELQRRGHPAVGHRLRRLSEQLNPRIIYTSISGFGAQGGPGSGKAMDSIIQALSGVMMTAGEPDEGPVRFGLPIGDLLAPLFAVIGTVSALLQAEHTGEGQHVDVSMLGALTSMMACEPFDAFDAVGLPQRTGSMVPRLAPFGIFPAADGHLALCAPTDPFARGVFLAMDRPDLADDPAWRTRDKRVAPGRRAAPDDQRLVQGPAGGGGPRGAHPARGTRRQGARSARGGPGPVGQAARRGSPDQPPHLRGSRRPVGNRCAHPVLRIQRQTGHPAPTLGQHNDTSSGKSWAIQTNESASLVGRVHHLVADVRTGRTPGAARMRAGLRHGHIREQRRRSWRNRMSTALDDLIAHYNDRAAAIREQRQRSRQVIGYVGQDVPVELITAAGALPVRLAGHPTIDTDRRRPVSRSWPGQVARSVLTRLLTGDFDYLDGLVISRDCEASLRLFYAIRELRRIDPARTLPPVHLVDLLHLPHRTTARSTTWRALDQLVDQLRAWTGQTDHRGSTSPPPSQTTTSPAGSSAVSPDCGGPDQPVDRGRRRWPSSAPAPDCRLVPTTTCSATARSRPQTTRTRLGYPDVPDREQPRQPAGVRTPRGGRSSDRRRGPRLGRAAVRTPSGRTDLAGAERALPVQRPHRPARIHHRTRRVHRHGRHPVSTPSCSFPTSGTSTRDRRGTTRRKARQAARRRHSRRPHRPAGLRIGRLTNCRGAAVGVTDPAAPAIDGIETSPPQHRIRGRTEPATRSDNRSGVSDGKRRDTSGNGSPDFASRSPTVPLALVNADAPQEIFRTMGIPVRGEPMVGLDHRRQAALDGLPRHCSATAATPTTPTSTARCPWPRRSTPIRTPRPGVGCRARRSCLPRPPATPPARSSTSGDNNQVSPSTRWKAPPRTSSNRTGGMPCPNEWETVIGTDRIDLMVGELEGLIRFLETTTGKVFRESRVPPE